MPALMTFYPGVMPWHFGGPVEFTVGEADELVKAAHKAAAEQRKQQRRGR